MDERDRHRAFANRGGAAFHRTVTNVAGREQAWHVRFQVVGRAFEGPVAGSALVQQVRPGHEIAGFVPTHERIRVVEKALGDAHLVDGGAGWRFTLGDLDFF